MDITILGICMAKIIEAKDLRGERRERLIDAVPLPAPWTMFIDCGNPCNARCVYCPTGDTELLRKIGRKNVLMSWELFTKVVGDIKAFPRRLKRVNSYKDGEPLIHPRFTDMMRYLKDADVTEQIWTKTNGLALKPEINARLVTCGLDMIGVSVQHVHAQGFYDIARVRIDYEEYRANVLDLYQRSRDTGVKISTKIADVGFSDADKQKFLDDFSDRCDFIAIEGLHGWSASDVKDWRLGTDNSFDGNLRTNKIACPLVLYMLTVNSNGNISICNDDAFHWHKIGNANNETLMDIWHGNRLREFRLMHLTGRKHENPACSTCDYVKVLPDSIDSDREEYARRLR
jgi:radical SAM protein with 4Fe4S-binding SPASM domain